MFPVDSFSGYTRGEKATDRVIELLTPKEFTGRSKDFTKYVQDKNKVLEMYESENIKLDAKLMKKANSYLDWIMYVYLFNQGRTITLKGEQYKISDIITLKVSNKKDLLKALAKEEVVEQIDLKEKIFIVKYKNAISK